MPTCSTFIDPNRFGFGAIIDFVAYGVVGGAGHWAAPVLGTLLVGLVPEMLRSLGELREIAIGIALVLIAIFAPWGLGDRRSWQGIRRCGRRPAESSPQVSKAARPRDAARTVELE